MSRLIYLNPISREAKEEQLSVHEVEVGGVGVELEVKGWGVLHLRKAQQSVAIDLLLEAGISAKIK